MEILSWLWWIVASVLSLLWTIVWFLISGWVSTLLQLLIVVAVIYVLKFGWRRAPLEMLRHGQTSGRMFWNWLRAKDGSIGGQSVEVREVIRVVRAKDFGDINLSTLMSLLMFAGLLWISTF